jgi:hypothetical protein
MKDERRALTRAKLVMSALEDIARRQNNYNGKRSHIRITQLIKILII